VILRIIACLLLACFAPSGFAQSPKAEVELDQIAIDTLKEMHNKGAELYNANDPSGCLKIYATALLTVKPFLKHRPEIQKVIDAGMAEVEKLDGAKAQAFRMHELIEKVRADLKAEPKKPVVPEPPVVALPAQIFGVLTLDGKPLAEAAITVIAGRRAFTATTDAGGKYAITDALPIGKYTVIVTGADAPAKFQSAETSGLTVDVVAGKNMQDVNLKSK